MLRRSDSQNKFDELIKKMFQKGAGQSEPDITQYRVNIGGKPFLIGERIYEINEDGKTVLKIISELDQDGRPFLHIKELVHCSCGCNINIRTNKVFRCFLCKQIICSKHSIQFKSQSTSFCKSLKCYSIGRLLQLGFYALKSINYSIKNIFGLELSHPTSPLTMKSHVDLGEENGINDSENFKKGYRRDYDSD